MGRGGGGCAVDLVARNSVREAVQSLSLLHFLITNSSI